MYATNGLGVRGANDYNLQRSDFRPHLGYSDETLLLIVAVPLLFWVFDGGVIVWAGGRPAINGA
jgi:hypothetical protein